MHYKPNSENDVQPPTNYLKDDNFQQEFQIDPSLKMLEVNEDEEYFKTTGSNSLKGSLVS